ncbi:hypothetical protein LXT21_20155 [Myxococcus sp. K38C18041901]|uniref:hypothetical protein n=1 Tax=Myxococcus guangdongensis TaxID=2906760 RepID=UPI0020A7E000|nr:hypothetical protein [Myxococcus guangdongensis]MCP3061097.1 hypothetical protein [Myxococcus guangdongensis]
MKQSLVVTAVLFGFSLLGCGGPVSEPEAVSESSQDSTLSQLACSGYPACGSLVNKRCFNEGEVQTCCDGDTTGELYCVYSNGRLIFAY